MTSKYPIMKIAIIFIAFNALFVLAMSKMSHL